jgi:hypothetical protein
VRDGRSALTKECRAEPRTPERLADIAWEWGMSRHRKIDVTRSHRWMGGRAGERMQSVEPVGPATNDHEVAEPWPERLDQSREGRGVVHVTRSG